MATRNRVARKMHVNGNGELSKSAQPDGVAVLFQFFDGPDDAEGKPTTSTEIRVDLKDVPGAGNVTGVARQALAHGIAQKVGDEYSSSGGDLNGSIEAAQAMVDRLLTGEWLTEREGGSSRGDKILFEAICNVLRKNGKNVDPETEAGAANIERINTALENKETAKGWKSRPDVKAEMEQIKLDRAQERAKKAKAAAKGVESGTGLDDFS